MGITNPDEQLGGILKMPHARAVGHPGIDGLNQAQKVQRYRATDKHKDTKASKI